MFTFYQQSYAFVNVFSPIFIIYAQFCQICYYTTINLTNTCHLFFEYLFDIYTFFVHQMRTICVFVPVRKTCKYPTIPFPGAQNDKLIIYNAHA